MVRHLLPVFIALMLSFSIPHSGSSQALTDADREAIRAVWAELDASVLAGELARLSRIYAENVIEVFRPDQVATGREALLDRMGSALEGLRASAHESQVESIVGERNTAVVWVGNTQTHVDRQTGAATWTLPPS